MPLDPVLIVDTKGWLQKAANDVRGAEIDLAAVPPLLEDAVFHCQQVAEKSLKAFLTFHNQPFRRTHNLEEIGEACLAIDPTLQPVIDDAVPLTEYAWAYRYPGPTVPLSQAEAASALNIVKWLYREVLDRIPPEAHP